MHYYLPCGPKLFTCSAGYLLYNNRHGTDKHGFETAGPRPFPCCIVYAFPSSLLPPTILPCQQTGTTAATCAPACLLPPFCGFVWFMVLVSVHICTHAFCLHHLPTTIFVFVYLFSLFICLLFWRTDQDKTGQDRHLTFPSSQRLLLFAHLLVS